MTFAPPTRPTTTRPGIREFHSSRRGRFGQYGAITTHFALTGTANRRSHPALIATFPNRRLEPGSPVQWRACAAAIAEFARALKQFTRPTMTKSMKLKSQKYFLQSSSASSNSSRCGCSTVSVRSPAFRSARRSRRARRATRCAFCPNTTVGDSLSQGEMEWDLFTKIVDEMSEHHMDEVHPFLMNEPLWDKELPKKIRYIADRRKPGSKMKIKINSNASFLTDDVGKQLIESRLDKINISFHGIRPEVYEFNMGNLKFEPMLKKVVRFKEQLGRRRANRTKAPRREMVKT